MVDFTQARTMMVDTQVRPNDVTKYPVIEAMLSVPREAFVPDARRSVAYVGENVPLSEDRWLLEPRSFGKMLDGLNIQPDELVLNIGAGLGYDAAVTACLAEAVVALESHTEMARHAETTLAEQGIDNVAVVTGGLTEGYPGQAPYDVILISGGIEQLPNAIADQLKEGGRVGAIFMEGGLGVARIGYKIDGQINWRFAFNAAVPVLPGFTRSAEFVF
ncbi:protein-L-isoaspartate O-methyltransferase [Paracoccus aurantiacus]|uniref:Protein-L-isoaspartate O-methyltransferase n=1 Tax=Paracoccus aurantiacus TaxID=2599412 RepID=A0A5C6S2Y7_9RHOB|nr:protein-L-isoaspartate O-methyltransferase [Paracoccus aurantiacus]TXB68815.1 protein-L-isoaspartate O-methyltransferase [Paracoccus aurantiacus]